MDALKYNLNPFHDDRAVGPRVPDLSTPYSLGVSETGRSTLIVPADRGLAIVLMPGLTTTCVAVTYVVNQSDDKVEVDDFRVLYVGNNGATSNLEAAEAESGSAYLIRDQQADVAAWRVVSASMRVTSLGDGPGYYRAAVYATSSATDLSLLHREAKTQSTKNLGPSRQFLKSVLDGSFHCQPVFQQGPFSELRRQFNRPPSASSYAWRKNQPIALEEWKALRNSHWEPHSLWRDLSSLANPRPTDARFVSPGTDLVYRTFFDPGAPVWVVDIPPVAEVDRRVLLEHRSNLEVVHRSDSTWCDEAMLTAADGACGEAQPPPVSGSDLDWMNDTLAGDRVSGNPDLFAAATSCRRPRMDGAGGCPDPPVSHGDVERGASVLTRRFASFREECRWSGCCGGGGSPPKRPRREGVDEPGCVDYWSSSPRRPDYGCEPEECGDGDATDGDAPDCDSE